MRTFLAIVPLLVLALLPLTLRLAVVGGGEFLAALDLVLHLVVALGDVALELLLAADLGGLAVGLLTGDVGALEDGPGQGVELCHGAYRRNCAS